jgi:murein L,D-transpeptidase YafK
MENSRYDMNDISRVDQPKIIVLKSERALTLYDGDVPVARMHVALGRDASGPKMREGDQRTPEGVYAVCVRNAESKYHLALGLDYPNISDAGRGLAEGIITQSQHDDIVNRISQRLRPPWDTGMGGEIMIHGGGSNRDWTAGCIALDNDCMDFLWKHVPLGTEVEIKP